MHFAAFLFLGKKEKNSIQTTLSLSRWTKNRTGSTHTDALESVVLRQINHAAGKVLGFCFCCDFFFSGKESQKESQLPKSSCVSEMRIVALGKQLCDVAVKTEGTK